MPAFISHSDKDDAIYSAVCLALDGAAGVDRWDPATMSPGDSLADQLQRAIHDCEVCVFLATRRSIESQWCLAELGAFWGAGKKVLLFLADPDLTDSVLPPQFKGNLLARNAYELIKSIKNATHEYRSVTIQIEKQSPYEFFDTSGDFGIERDWLKLLDETTETFDILGITLSAWRRTKDFGKIVLEKANAGCRIRVLLIHSDNALFKGLIYLELSSDNVVRYIEESYEYYSNLAAKHSNIEVRQMRRGMPHFFLTRTDQHAVVILYLSSQTWGSGPTWRCKAGSSLYRLVLEEFETLWKVSAEGANPPSLMPGLGDVPPSA